MGIFGRRRIKAPKRQRMKPGRISAPKIVFKPKKMLSHTSKAAYSAPSSRMVSSYKRAPYRSAVPKRSHSAKTRTSKYSFSASLSRMRSNITNLSRYGSRNASSEMRTKAKVGGLGKYKTQGGASPLQLSNVNGMSRFTGSAVRSERKTYYNPQKKVDIPYGTIALIFMLGGLVAVLFFIIRMLVLNDPTL